jgi:LysM repeat protein
MKKNTYLMILFVLILSLALGGCTRSATKSTDGDVPVETPDIPFPVGPENSQGRITEIIAVTQTAGAAMEKNVEEEEQPVSTATPEAAVEEPEATEEPAPTQQPIVVPTATPGLPTTYTLQEGEYPYCIARRFNINPNDLLSVNNISGFVSPGTTLTIPTDSTWPAEFERSLIAHPTTYNVVAGDTIYKIACAFGDVDPIDIIAANNLEEPYTLTAGQVINIP